MNEPAPQPEGTYLTTQELAARWKRTPNAIIILRHRRRAPKGFLNGGKLLFPLAAVEEFEAAQKGADSRFNTALDPTKKPAEARGSRRRTAEAA